MVKGFTGRVTILAVALALVGVARWQGWLDGYLAGWMVVGFFALLGKPRLRLGVTLPLILTLLITSVSASLAHGTAAEACATVGLAAPALPTVVPTKRLPAAEAIAARLEFGESARDG